MKDYLALTKPRITVLILVCAAVGFFFGAKGDWSLAVFLHAMMGTALLASGTAALNQWYEREADARMRRTRSRPLPSGRLAPTSALMFGILLAIAGFFELAVWVNWPSAILGMATLVSYLFAYTPLKQRSPLSTSVGAIPGAMPPLIGYAAASGRVDPEALALCAILFIWQFPHFYAIAWMYREDYSRAGIKMLPVVAPDGRSTAQQIVIYSLLLVPTSLVPAAFSMAGGLYVAGAVALGVVFLLTAVKVSREMTVGSARRVLVSSVIYLPVLLGLMVADHTLGWLRLN
jgi:heme o synthase